MASSVAVTSQELGALIAQDRRRWRVRSGLIAGLLLLIATSFWAAGLLDPRRLARGGPSIVLLVGEMLPPDFRHARDWVVPLGQTLVMSVAGTGLAFALAFPLGILAARNVSPSPLMYGVARFILNVLRALPEMILGILFVAAVGFGALPGTLALGLHSAGMVGKFFAEAMEHVDPGPVEAVRATGASSLQVILHGVLPQVLPQMGDVSMYRWEFNFRASTVLGMVGAGGIGFELIASLRIMQYREVSALLLVILAMVTLIDSLSGLLRRRLK